MVILALLVPLAKLDLKESKDSKVNKALLEPLAALAHKD
jgi:hypothetical protein